MTNYYNGPVAKPIYFMTLSPKGMGSSRPLVFLPTEWWKEIKSKGFGPCLPAAGSSICLLAHQQEHSLKWNEINLVGRKVKIKFEDGLDPARSSKRKRKKMGRKTPGKPRAFLWKMVVGNSLKVLFKVLFPILMDSVSQLGWFQMCGLQSQNSLSMTIYLSIYNIPSLPLMYYFELISFAQDWGTQAAKSYKP